MNKVPYILNENSLTIFLDGNPHTLRSDHLNFQVAKKAILNGDTHLLSDLVDIEKAIENFIEGDIEVKDEVVYYKGHRLHGVVVDKLLEMLRAGLKDSAPITNFIARLQANPSANSVAELYSFMSYKSLPNTPEGKILGYKGVQSDYWSSTGNADTIVLQGKTNERHQILNEVDSTIEVARRCVDDNKDNHCSFGLHVGSYDYADGWAGEDGRLLVVEFDPADAVSVPTDCNFQKLRVSKYKVVSDITDNRKELNKPIYEANKPIYGSDDDVDFGDDEDYDDESDFVDVEMNNDDDDYDMDKTDKDDGWVKVDEQVLVEDEDEEDLTDEELVTLSVQKYITKKHEKNIYPTIKQVADLRICKANGVGYRGVADIVKQMDDANVDNSYKASLLPLGARQIFEGLPF
jgi:hypothetical protein